ncbi:uncharacterized protein LOC129145155 isoform X2 [Talpa occidentalis]|uniref:uncharacterized protein LOC129145155 isoform X2 n=1 Tax=Talpa occidentalis TaxID=50954 RepID=UPI0023FA27D0|nr:uncharacterized protein LOC129145155 isoform X2 [Talpa occidentalis]
MTILRAWRHCIVGWQETRGWTASASVRDLERGSLSLRSPPPAACPSATPPAHGSTWGKHRQEEAAEEPCPQNTTPVTQPCRHREPLGVPQGFPVGPRRTEAQTSSNLPALLSLEDGRMKAQRGSEAEPKLHSKSGAELNSLKIHFNSPFNEASLDLSTLHMYMQIHSSSQARPRLRSPDPVSRPCVTHWLDASSCVSHSPPRPQVLWADCIQRLWNEKGLFSRGVEEKDPSLRQSRSRVQGR